MALAEVSAGDHLGSKFVVVAEIKMLADGDFAAGADQTFPVVGIVAELAGQKDLDAPLKKVAGGRILRAERLGLKTSAPAVESGGKHASIVEDDEVAGPEKIGKFAELAILESAALGREVQKAGRSAVRKRLLGD